MWKIPDGVRCQGSSRDCSCRNLTIPGFITEGKLVRVSSGTDQASERDHEFADNSSSFRAGSVIRQGQDIMYITTSILQAPHYFVLLCVWV